MKILFYTNSIYTFGGVQRVLAVIAKELSQKHDVTILTLDPREREDRSMYGLCDSAVKTDFMEYPEAGGMENLCCKAASALYKKVLPKTGLTAGLYAKSSFLPSRRRRLADYINRGGFDVVVGVHIFLSLHLAAIRSAISAKTIGWMHNSFGAMFEKENPYMPRVLHDFCRRQLRRLDQVIVLSDHDRHLFMERMQLPTVRIYNPLTIDVKGQADYTARRFLSIGRMENGHKGFDILINAFAEFAKTNAEWKLDLVGDGPLKANLQRQIDTLGLHNRITIHPFTKQVEDYYTSTSAYVLASRWEGMPLVLCEAMAYGHSIIASEIPITSELLKDQPFASLFPVGDTAALAELLKKKAVEDLCMQGKEAKKYTEQFFVDIIKHSWGQLFTRQ